MNNLCYGCAAYKKDEYGDYCEYSVHNTEVEGICPCVKCLIKSVCDEACDDFLNWKLE